MNNKCKWIVKYSKVTTAIPKGWQTILSGEQTMENILDADMQLNCTEVTILFESISINNMEKELGKIKSKDIHFACLYPTKTSKCIEAWTNIYGKPIQWPKVFKSVYSTLQSRKKLLYT